MIVQCPSCKAKFNLADGKITEKGTKVRCSKCRFIFEVKKEAPKESSASSPAPPAEEEDKFNFGEDFDFTEEKISTERAPATPAHQDYAFSADTAAPAKKKAKEQKEEPAKEEFSFEEEADFSSEEFGSEPKSNELGISADMPEIPSEEKEGFGGEESSFDEGIDDFKIDRGSEIPAKSSAESEEFDFSEKLESYARSERVPTRAGKEDELEADLDIEAPGPQPAATAQVREPIRAAPSRAPSISYERKETKAGKKALIILIILLLIPIGGLGYLHFQSSFTFSDLLKGDFAKLKRAPELEKILVALKIAKPSIKGQVSVLSYESRYVERRDGRSVFVVQGKVKNEYPVGIRFILVGVDLFDRQGDIVASKTSYCDYYAIKSSDIETLPESDLEALMNLKPGKTMGNLEVEPNGLREFTIIFFRVPKEVANYDEPKVLNFEIIGQEK